jgi:hypothetical protein
MCGSEQIFVVQSTDKAKLFAYLQRSGKSLRSRVHVSETHNLVGLSPERRDLPLPESNVVRRDDFAVIQIPNALWG